MKDREDTASSVCSLWHDGVLLRVLGSASVSDTTAETSSGNSSSSTSSSKTSSHWIILEGVATPYQMDALAASCQDNTITLSNGHSFSLDPSVKFILEVSMMGLWPQHKCLDCSY